MLLFVVVDVEFVENLLMFFKIMDGFDLIMDSVIEVLINESKGLFDIIVSDIFVVCGLLFDLGIIEIVLILIGSVFEIFVIFVLNNIGVSESIFFFLNILIDIIINGVENVDMVVLMLIIIVVEILIEIMIFVDNVVSV